jgi:putative ABC transport system substrate-binding protein
VGALHLDRPRSSAYYVDTILKGTKPGDLPVEQPMKFQFVVNMKTAKLLGLTMPPEIMVRATRVIQ